MDKRLENKIRNNFKEAIGRFNFVKVSNVMNYLNWTWGWDEYPPSRKRMEKAVNELFETALEEFEGKELSVSSGGFRVVIYNLGKVEILFVVTYSHSLD